MSPSQEVLHSIENRLLELEAEIAALESARAELQAGAPVASDEAWVAQRAAQLAAQSRAAAA